MLERLVKRTIHGHQVLDKIQVPGNNRLLSSSPNKPNQGHSRHQHKDCDIGKSEAVNIVGFVVGRELLKKQISEVKQMGSVRKLCSGQFDFHQHFKSNAHN